MSTIDENKQIDADNEMMKQWEGNHRRGRLVGGFAVVIVGALFLAREMGVWIPDWVFTWQMLLIVIGIVGALKHRFQTFGWIIPILVGIAFLLRDYMPELNITHFVWPIAIIFIGLIMIFRPKRKACRGNTRWHRHRFRHHEQWRQWQEQQQSPKDFSQADFLEFNSVFGGIKKNVITKNFRGGEVNAVFGGAEINLMQADFEGTVELEINCVFGGASLIIPANWEVKSEIAAVMGSVEDKRSMHKEIVTDANKVLILRGNAVFGGIEIQSF